MPLIYHAGVLPGCYEQKDMADNAGTGDKV